MHLKEQFIIFFTILISGLYSAASPVRNSIATYTQPDGKRFEVIIRGDEWTKVRTTTDGCAITKGDDGWWCYAVYDEEGRISSTGHHVGLCISQDILNASRRIPYAALAQKAQQRRDLGAESRTRALRSMQQRSAMTKASSGQNTVKGLAILVQFQDTQFKYSKEDFSKMLNEQGYNGTGSAKDYFSDQFGEGWDFTFDVSDIVTVDKLVKYYGANDQDDNDIRPAELIRDACRLADASVDFSQYDMDNDGEVDNVYVFYAGEDEAINTEKTDLLWAHQWYIYSGAGISLTCDGKRIDRYACSSELESRGMAGIGAFSHEFSHTFGLLDLYDTNYDEDGADKWSAGVWRKTSLMDGGSYNNQSRTPPYYNCIEREMLFLSAPVILEEGNTYTLEPIHKNGMFARLETDTKGEYYLFECRKEDGWDKYIGGSGLLVYHIDKNVTEKVSGRTVNKWSYNTVNNDPDHLGADLIEADNRPHVIPPDLGLKIFSQSISDIFFPLNNVTAMTPESHPSYKFWSGQQPPLVITGIKRVGENISFTVVDAQKLAEVADVENVTITRFPDAAIVQFSASKDIPDSRAVLQWKRQDEDSYKEVEVDIYEGNVYAYKIDGLASDNVQYDITIHFERGASIGNTYKQSFMTKRKSSALWPYIYFNDLSDSPDGSFKKGDTIPLHVVNATSATSVEWYFDDGPIDTGKHSMFKVTDSGTICAKVRWRNGSCDTIIKEISVK